MSSVSNSGRTEPQQNFWSKAAPYVVPYVASGVAIACAFRGFSLKSAKQLGVHVRTLPFYKAYKPNFQDIKSEAPRATLVIGTQFVVQSLVENKLDQIEKRLKQLPFDDKSEKSTTCLLTSTVVVAVATAPLLAWFNIRTMPKKMVLDAAAKSLSHKDVVMGIFREIYEAGKSLSPKEFTMVVVREASFLATPGLSEKITKAAKKEFGDNKVVTCSTNFTSGCIASVVSHVPDTCFTRWQKKMPVEYYHLFLGVFYRAMGVGTFNVINKEVSAQLTPKKS